MFAAGLGARLSKTLAQVNNRDDLAAQIYYSFDVVGGVRHCRDLGNAHNFVDGGDRYTISLTPDLEPDNVQLLFHGSPGQDFAATAARARGSGWRPRCCALSSTNRSMASMSARAIFDICSADAASSVEPEVVCCTSSRMRSIALTTACAPDACSSTAEFISCVSSLRRVVARAICDEPCDCSLVAAPISCANL